MWISLAKVVLTGPAERDRDFFPAFVRPLHRFRQAAM
jgi:hypothetical protein